MESRVHRLIGVGLALMFGVFVLVQLNDPDPLPWITVYGMLMGMVVVSMFKPLPVMLSVLTMMAAVAGAVLLWPSDYMGLTGNMSQHSQIELARESLGLLICAGTCLYLAVRSYQRTRNRDTFFA